MSGRRSHVRYMVSPPSHGVIRVFSDAEIEGIGQDALSVIAHEPAALHERMLVEMSGDEADVVVPVRVAESRPIIVGSAVRHSVRLEMLARGPGDWALAAAPGGRRAGAVHPGERPTAIVIREFAVRLLNCSRSGCLVEADRALPAGTAGTMTLEIDGHAVTDHILVTRCQSIAGAGTLHHIGARLLWVAAPSAQTIRHVLTPAENPV